MSLFMKLCIDGPHTQCDKLFYCCRLGECEVFRGCVNHYDLVQVSRTTLLTKSLWFRTDVVDLFIL